MEEVVVGAAVVVVEVVVEEVVVGAAVVVVEVVVEDEQPSCGLESLMAGLVTMAVFPRLEVNPDSNTIVLNNKTRRFCPVSLFMSLLKACLSLLAIAVL